MVSASNYACVMSGVLATVLYLRIRDAEDRSWLEFSWLGLAILLLTFGYATRPEWGISKIQATPSWTAICTGIGLVTLVVLFGVADRKGWTGWAKFIEPAGTSTLTCYLIPYFAYALMSLTGWSLPEVLTTGYIGLAKSLAFGLLIIYITGLLNSWFQVRLRV